MARTLRANDFTLEYVADLLEKQGILTDDAKRTAFARENGQRARLLRDQASRSGGRALRRAELSPVEVRASFKCVDASREGEAVDEDKATQTIARVVGIPYRKIDPLKLDAHLITRTLSRPFARKHAVLPLEGKNGVLVVATANPFDRELFENLRGLTGAEIEPARHRSHRRLERERLTVAQCTAQDVVLLRHRPREAVCWVDREAHEIVRDTACGDGAVARRSVER